MPKIDALVNWFNQRAGKVTYSQNNRYGPDSYDCSSAIYYAMIAGGFFPPGKMGNTETLFNDLEALGWQTTTTPKRGDIFIWGRRGYSDGNGGHTGVFRGAVQIIHCNGTANGISVNKYTTALANAGNPPAVIYSNPLSDGNPESVLDTPEKQVAWAVRLELGKAGYTLEAIAGVLGNAQAESAMNPDLDQVGGPAYGLWQWDGSAHPLAGPPTSNGRQYVKNLLAAANIKGDYRDETVQTKLLLWTMANGQWIGAVDPKTVDAFKQCQNVHEATYAFMKNYERPGVERLQERYDAADYWFNLFNGLDVDEDADTFETMTNVGELEELSVKDRKIYAKGWHFSSDKPLQFIVFYNAETDEEIKRIQVTPSERPDIAERYPDVLGIINCGFNVSIDAPKDVFVYIKAIRSNGQQTDELLFDSILLVEYAEDAVLSDYPRTNTKFYFEILEKGKVIKRGNKLLNDLSWNNSVMEIPMTEIILPIAYKKYVKEREEIRLYVNRKVFHGIVIQITENKQVEQLTIQLAHIIDEWRFQQISTNLAVKNRTLFDLYSTLDFRYDGWDLDFLQDSGRRKIDYVFSRQNKLEGISKTCELTDDLFLRVGFNYGRKLEFGTFGEKKPLILSNRPSGRNNRQIIEEPEIEYLMDHVVNIATVYGEKSDSGMSSMSLREVYNEPSSFIPGFPVVILRNRINNERGYDYIQFSKLAPNNDLEYAVIDEEGIALESGRGIQTTLAFNDLAPFAVDGDEVSDEDRARASRVAYEAAVKILKQRRRRKPIRLTIEELPETINVGDRIRLLYDNILQKMDGCSNYEKKMLLLDDWFYITSIDYIFDSEFNETNVVTLEKRLHLEREGNV